MRRLPGDSERPLQNNGSVLLACWLVADGFNVQSSDNGLMRIAVVRNTGFIAPHIIHRLLERGHHVVDDEGSEAGAVVCVHLFTQEDAEAAVAHFRGRTGKLVVLSSGDVYRAYGKLQGTEP